MAKRQRHALAMGDAINAHARAAGLVSETHGAALNLPCILGRIYPDDAALELLQKWLQRRRAGAAAIGFVTRADDGQRELSLRVAGAGFAEPLPAGDEVPATLSLLRSGRKSLLIEDGGFIASHFGRAAKRRLGTDCRGVTCALVALGDDEASRCGVIEVLSARPLGRAGKRARASAGLNPSTSGLAPRFLCLVLLAC